MNISYRRFWDKVSTSGLDDCWEWQAYRCAKGYGRFWQDGRMRKSHRVSLSMVESAPFSGAHVMHSCDNPSCCNPFHLKWCTYAENNKDKEEKGRHYKGQFHHNSKYTDEIADSILKLKALGYTCSEVSDKLGLKVGGVMNVYIGRSWKHRHGVNGNPTTEQINSMSRRGRIT